MSSAASSIPELRRLLSERFPQVARAPAAALLTGIPGIDESAGGLPRHAITEVVCLVASCGSQLVLGQLLAETRARLIRVALIDGTDSFDPCSHATDRLSHVIWIRCHEAASALQAADLFARDANLGLVVLDLRDVPETELRRIPNRQWYRLQRAVESTDLALVVITPRPLVASAQLRLVLDRTHPTAALEQERPTLIAELAPTLQRQRVNSHSAVA